MIDPIDEYCVQQLEEYDGKNLICASKEGMELGDSEDEQNTREDEKKAYENVCRVINQPLSDKVDKVVFSEGLCDYPCFPATGE